MWFKFCFESTVTKTCTEWRILQLKKMTCQFPLVVKLGNDYSVSKKLRRHFTGNILHAETNISMLN